jgi:hypothetical protein
LFGSARAPLTEPRPDGAISQRLGKGKFFPEAM